LVWQRGYHTYIELRREIVSVKTAREVMFNDADTFGLAVPTVPEVPLVYSVAQFGVIGISNSERNSSRRIATFTSLDERVWELIRPAFNHDDFSSLVFDLAVAMR
jgi:hypothetical protein